MDIATLKDPTFLPPPVIDLDGATHRFEPIDHFTEDDTGAVPAVVATKRLLILTAEKVPKFRPIELGFVLKREVEASAETILLFPVWARTSTSNFCNPDPAMTSMSQSY